MEGAARCRSGHTAMWCGSACGDSDAGPSLHPSIYDAETACEAPSALLDQHGSADQHGDVAGLW
jgi:hypothetical protein